MKNLVKGQLYTYKYFHGIEFKILLFYLIEDNVYKPSGQIYYKFFDMLRGNIFLVSHYYRARLSEFNFEDTKELTK